mmetsp:Transcript_62821/g.185519  ORF Transcript_62821/g.185519 Transcript_62821/m.185519 type:complete len:80 (+) Transcript_62821:1013-1252(+)
MPKMLSKQDIPSPLPHPIARTLGVNEFSDQQVPTSFCARPEISVAITRCELHHNLRIMSNLFFHAQTKITNHFKHSADQ